MTDSKVATFHPNFMRDLGYKVRNMGYRLIPITPGTKACYEADWPNIKAAPEDITRWAKVKPYGIGIITTETPVLDLDCFDEDFVTEFRNEIDIRFNRPPMRIGDAPKVAILFRTLAPFNKVRSAEYLTDKGRKAQLEILGKGEQFVAFAIHPRTRKPYKWEDDYGPATVRVEDLVVLTAEDRQWAVELFERMAEARGWQRRSPGSSAPADGDNELRGDPEPPDWERKLPRIMSALAAFPPAVRADYDLWCVIVAALHYESGGSEEGLQVAEDWSGPGWEGPEKKTVRELWGTFRRKPEDGDVATAGKIYYLANKQYGWVEPGRDSGPLRLIHYDDVQPRLLDGYVVKGLIGPQSFVLLYGTKNTGKTWFALDISLSIAAAGRRFFGRRVRQAGVIYVAAEAGRSIENRVWAAKQKFGSGLPFAAITTPIDLRSNDVDLKRLVEKIKSQNIGAPVEFVTIDTLSRVLAGGDENAPGDMGALVMNLDRLREQLNTTIFLVHHAGKNENRGPRGHSLLVAAADTVMESTYSKAAHIFKVQVEHQRDYPIDGLFPFVLREIEIGRDSDDELIKSCVIEETSFEAIQADKILSMSTRNAVEILENLCRGAADNRANESEWKDSFIKSNLTTEAKTPKARAEAFRRMKIHLLEERIISCEDGKVWLNDQL